MVVYMDPMGSKDLSTVAWFPGVSFGFQGESGFGSAPQALHRKPLSLNPTPRGSLEHVRNRKRPLKKTPTPRPTTGGLHSI